MDARYISLRTLVVGGALLLGPALTRPALSCSCAEPAPELAYERAAAVFVGTVTRIERPFSDWIGLTRSDVRLVHFAVTQRWKGVPLATMTVRAQLTGEACGYPFRADET